MASTLTPERTPDHLLPHPLLQLAALPPLPYALDVSAPTRIPVAARAGGDKSAAVWPYPIAYGKLVTLALTPSGPSTAPEETLDAFVTRRYYETLFLGEMFAPLAGLVADLERAGAAHSEVVCASIARHMLGLGAIEARHRRVLGPVVAALLASAGCGASAAKVADAFRNAGLEGAERDALSTAVELSAAARAVVEGEKSLLPRHITDEFERREVLIQVVFLLVYRAHPHPEPPKKRKRKGKEKERADPPPPTDDIDASLELLADRISVWAAVAELGIGDTSADTKRPPNPTQSIPAQLKSFWDTVLVPSFIPREASFCTSFHAKVFGTPIPADLVPQKKPRKPKVTRRLDVKRDKRTAKPAEPAPAPAPAPAPTALRRSTSSRKDDRSRSSSTNPPDALPALPVRRIMRAPSGSIKMREVSFRRTNSLARSQSQSQTQSQLQTQPQSQIYQSQSSTLGLAQSGLLGRNLRIGDRDRPPAAGVGAGAAPSAGAGSQPLILATPAKKTHNIFARHQAHPTPIQEEPSSAGGSSYVAETPARRPLGGLAFDTPMQPLRFAAETPLGRASRDTGDGDPSFDELMVPTDDEGDGDDSGGAPLVPETPRRP